MRHRSIRLIEKDGYVILGPDFAEIVKKFTAFMFVSEVVFITSFAIIFLLWILGFLGGVTSLIIVTLAFGLTQMGLAIGLVMSMRNKLKKHTRFTLRPEGEITVKDEKNNDVTLEPGSEIEFVCSPQMDRKGNVIYDLVLKYDRNTYYLLSGSEQDDMENLAAALSKACFG